MTFTYPKKRRRSFKFDRVVPFDFPREDEGLTGFVQGQKASDLEERVARALSNNNIRFQFRVFVPTQFSFPGQSKELDFMVFFGLIVQPLSVKGPVSHSTSAQIQDDFARENLLNPVFAQGGALPLRSLFWWQLETQEDADKAIRDLF